MNRLKRTFKKVKKWFLHVVMCSFKTKSKQAHFDCPKCGKYYRFKHIEKDHYKADVKCGCGAWSDVYINNNKVTNINWTD